MSWGVMMTGHDGGRLLLNLDQLIDLFCQDTIAGYRKKRRGGRRGWVGMMNLYSLVAWQPYRRIEDGCVRVPLVREVRLGRLQGPPMKRQ